MGYAYFDRTAPSIAKTASYNGSDIRVYFDHKDEALEPEYSAAGYVTGYHIKYADNKNMTDAASVILKDKKASSKVITGLKNGRTYYVQIQHYAKLGKATYWSRWSRISSVTVGQNPLSCKYRETVHVHRQPYQGRLAQNGRRVRLSY